MCFYICWRRLRSSLFNSSTKRFSSLIQQTSAKKKKKEEEIKLLQWCNCWHSMVCSNKSISLFHFVSWHSHFRSEPIHRSFKWHRRRERDETTKHKGNYARRGKRERTNDRFNKTLDQKQKHFSPVLLIKTFRMSIRRLRLHISLTRYLMLQRHRPPC